MRVVQERRRVRELQTLMGERGKPIIGITVGDPAGIGPEIAAKAAADASVVEWLVRSAPARGTWM